ncbi:HK97 family phage major capsid protein [Rhodococcus sp. AG1013]|uniref:phage major capsid protein n=1 Tax=Rhodococcus sp. AG1013 TaxID=2183996 RepID=UPI000E0AA678|nr:phage major capsid protein [Rhodococcus sp. AG1013]RDI13456.1 HK97 family phage major capsid protein [Rhodococcus sp. AG1013]
MNLKEKRAAKLAEAKAIVDGAKAAKAELTDEQTAAISTLVAEVKTLDESISKAADAAEILSTLDGLADASAEAGAGDGEPEGGEPKGRRAPVKSRTLGEHFVKEATDALARAKGQRFSITSADYKAAADTHVVTGWGAGTPLLTDYDKQVVQAFRPKLTIADLLGKGQISGNAISYLVEGAREGGFATVAEAGAKPQMHYVNPTAVVDALKKLAGFIKLSDEFIEDAPFLKSEIDGRLLYDLAAFEEAQLLNGNGTGQNLTGLLTRSGIQTEASTTAADHADAVFRSITKISTASGLNADGIVINPIDYQAFRLSKDANGQYFGGGFFAGQYGNGGVPMDPPLWGLRTVVTPAIAAGTVLVGAFSQAATLYRKGGVRVEATNSHDDDFTNNLVTIRAEERVALAVRRPLGLVKLTLSNS